MAYETIIVDVDDHVARITLNRPDALNALSDELLGELADAVTEAQKDDKVRCIVITGSEKAFAAGADIAMMAEKGFVDTFMGNLFAYITSMDPGTTAFRLSMRSLNSYAEANELP